MADEPDFNQLLADGFTFEIDRYPDTPLNRGDRVVYADERSGRLLVARAPILLQRA